MSKKRVVKEDGRYRLFFVEVYHESDSYDYEEVCRNLKSLGEYAYITHCNDLDDNGNLKKIHDHWVIKRDNAMSGKAFYKKTGIPLQFCQEVINERSCIRYLVHYDEPLKYQYSIDDIHCSGKYRRQVNKCFQDKESDEEIISNIYNFINDLNKKVNNKYEASYLLVQYINSQCYDSIYKRYRYEIQDYLNIQF